MCYNVDIGNKLPKVFDNSIQIYRHKDMANSRTDRHSYL
nr:MAG TPA: hypothetical protein [Caudoviricetes sp.]